MYSRIPLTIIIQSTLPCSLAAACRILATVLILLFFIPIFLVLVRFLIGHDNGVQVGDLRKQVG